MVRDSGAKPSLISKYGNAESVLTVLRITRTTDSIAPLFSVPSFTLVARVVSWEKHLFFW